jgi:hypothetical protein
VLEVQPDQVDFIVADLDLYTRGEVVALALNMDANLRSSPPLGTPVDTGWARANWLPSVGEPMIVEAGLRSPEPGQVAARADEGQQGLNNLLAWRLEEGPIFDTNNVPYIGVLNAGHSSQSPPGFVQNALEQAVKETESAGANRAARFRRASTARANKPRPKR